MFLANENFPKPSISLLRENGYNVSSIQEEYPGISDEAVMILAKDFNLISLPYQNTLAQEFFQADRPYQKHFSQITSY